MRTVPWGSGRRQEREETGSGAGRGRPTPQFASDVSALKALHLEKLLSLKQARATAQPTKEEEENCRHCLSTGVLSQQLVMESPDLATLLRGVPL